MPLTKTQRTFLKDTLKVEPKKKPYFSLFSGVGDDATQANTAFEIYLEKESSVIDKLAELGRYRGTADQVVNFEVNVNASQCRAQEAKDSADFKEKFPIATAELTTIGK
jgi:hypothetical protein